VGGFFLGGEPNKNETQLPGARLEREHRFWACHQPDKNEGGASAPENPPGAPAPPITNRRQKF